MSQRTTYAVVLILSCLFGAAWGSTDTEASNPVDDLIDQGWIAYQSGDAAAAGRSFEAALELARKGEPDSVQLGRALGSVAVLRHTQGAYDEAISLAEQAFEILEAAVGNESPEIASLNVNLAGIYLTRGADDRAALLLERAIAVIEKENPRSFELAIALSGLANCRQKQGQWVEAEALYLRSLVIIQESEGPTLYEPDIHNNLGLLYEKQLRLDEAEEQLRLAHAQYLQVLDPMHPRVGAVLSNLGRVCQAAGREEDAVAFYREGLRIKEKTLGPDHPDLVSTLTALASVLNRLGDLEEALVLAQRALRLAERSYPPEHEAVDWALEALASIHRSRGEYDLAGPLFDRSLAIRKGRLGPDHPDVALLLSSIGGLYRLTERYAEALKLQQTALAMLEKDESTRAPMGLCLHRLANLYRDMGQTDKAEQTYLRSLDLFAETFGPVHSSRLDALRDYINFLRDSGREDEANEFIQRYVEENVGAEEMQLERLSTRR